MNERVLKSMEKRSGIGRPPKYLFLLSYLDESQVYSPSTIARLIVPNPEENEILYRRIKQAFNGRVKTKQLQINPDGFLSIKGQGKDAPAWYPKTWRIDIEPEDLVPPKPHMTLIEAREYLSTNTSSHQVLNSETRPTFKISKVLPKLPFAALASCFLVVAASLFFFFSFGKLFTTDAHPLDVVEEPISPDRLKAGTERSQQATFQNIAQFTQFIRENREMREKFSYVTIPVDANQLTGWQKQVKEHRITTHLKMNSPTVFLINLKGSELFPE